MGFCRFSVLWLREPVVPCLPSVLQVSFLEKKVTELENDSLASGGLKSKLKLENVQLVHRSGQGARGAQRSHCQGRSPGLSDPAPLGLDCRPDRYSWMHSPRACDSH